MINEQGLVGLVTATSRSAAKVMLLIDRQSAVDAVIQKVDLDAVLGGVDVNQIMQRVDVDALVERTELGSVVARSTAGV